MKKPTERYIMETHPDSGCALIHEERMRQISSEGWVEAHDDEHKRGELALAAAAYAIWFNPALQAQAAELWPWEAQWLKPDDANMVRNLVKAGALIAAEIDRLKRLEGKQEAK